MDTPAQVAGDSRVGTIFWNLSNVVLVDSVMLGSMEGLVMMGGLNMGIEISLKTPTTLLLKVNTPGK